MKAFYGSGRVSLAALATAALATPAVAQDGAPPSSPATPAATANDGLREIIVTASRRAENLQKESRAINVIGAEELTRQGITDPSSVQRLVPGFTIATNGGQLQVSVRGVGDRTVTNATDPAVALNVDGVYYPKTYEASAFFFDLDRVEVLKGPQGTLYGRNASAGAVNLITAKPKFETSGFAEFEYGNYDAKRLTGAVNTSLNSTVALRLSGQLIDRDGYLTDGSNDDKEQALRAQMLIAPTDDTSLLLVAAYSHHGGKGSASVLARGTLSRGALDAGADGFEAATGLLSATAPALPGNPWAGPSDPRTLAYLNAVGNAGAARIIEQNGDQAKLDIDTYTFAATFEHKFDWATLTLMPAYVGSKMTDLDFSGLTSAVYQKVKSNQLSMEARLSSSSDARIKWVAGGFAAAEDVNSIGQVRIPIAPTLSFNSLAITPRLADRTWALFGEANASLADRFRLIAGARYTWEKKSTRGYVASVFEPFAGFPLTSAEFPAEDPDLAPPVNGQRVDKAFNYRAGFEYDVAPRSMVYGTVSTGFKAGGFFNYLAGFNGYKPEKLTAFQAGMKNRFFNNRFQFNFEGFYWKYRDKQETFLSFFGPPYGYILDTANAGRVTMYGGEISTALNVTRNDTVTADIEYVHSKYDQFTYSFVGSPDPTINCPAATDTAGVTTVDCSGNTLIRAPKWTGRVTYTHTQSLGNAGALTFNAGMRFSSSYWLANNFTTVARAKSFQTYDASLTWELPGGRYALSGFIRNIGNTPVYDGGLGTSSLTNASIGQIEAPRTYGARLRATF